LQLQFSFNFIIASTLNRDAIADALEQVDPACAVELADDNVDDELDPTVVVGGGN
jgi:hypothetical protein